MVACGQNVNPGKSAPPKPSAEGWLEPEKKCKWITPFFALKVKSAATANPTTGRVYFLCFQHYPPTKHFPKWVSINFLRTFGTMSHISPTSGTANMTRDAKASFDEPISKKDHYHLMVFNGWSSGNIYQNSWFPLQT